MQLHWSKSVDSLTQSTHEELIRLVAQGDEAAFEQLYDSVAARVYGLVLKVLRDPSQSQEVTQEIFVDIWTQAARFDADRGKAMSWILMMAHRRAVDRVRASQASTDRDLREGIKEYKESYDDVAQSVETAMEAQRVNEALITLSSNQQEAIRLAYYGGYTHQEVAEILKIPVGTVKTRIRDGMIKLRDRLGVS
ncbi:ECF RNA polymerase sigma factor SigK [Arthrobacter cryoconiti]|uniref:ECF RNA polymerase sigma factor SigK n=1 Tax=Arthrobacter cryoconiti TaxID=748907 RepID=A0ABV8R1J7_9MICC|nr:ECF RNA polymerase sigma factor SigK [Arthrobacter cryoconiti]MCC9068295.1 ECF RNA polymerase sigma factor SigK [Arthrobacter cryoconiti]